MTKKTFTLLVACLFVFKAMAQQVEQVQRTLITKIAATWCSPCGSWGWSMFDGLVEDNEDKAVLIAAHHSGLLDTPEGSEIAQNFNAFSQPRFFVNEADISASSSNYPTKRAGVEQMVNDAFLSSPLANVGFEPVFGNSTLTVDAKVKFFQAAEGDYFLGIYLIEDGVVEFQQSIGSGAVHKKILRGGFSDETFGEPFADGQISAGSEFNLSFELLIGAVQGYDYEVAGIIWKKVSDKFIPVNVWSTKTIGESTSTTDVSGLIGFEVTPNITNNEAVVNIDLQENLSKSTLDIIDISGKTVVVLGKGTFVKGMNAFTIDKATIGGNGMFFVRFTDGVNVSTKRVIFQ